MSDREGAAPLPVGTSVDGCVIDRVTEQGRYSISYIAIENGRTMVVREFAAGEFSVRDGLTPRAAEAEDRNALRWWLRSFIDQCQILARLKHVALPNVHRVFEANGTAYAVSDPVAGEALESMLQRDGTLEEDALRSLLKSVLDGLERAHAAGLLHRDIRPQNVVMRADGSAVLVDFAVLRTPVRLKSGLLSGAGVAPYAAPEELAVNGSLGPWTDLYALGALAFRAVSGREPPSAQQRRGGAPLPAAAQATRVHASDALLRAIDWALMLQPEARPQTVAEWRAALLTGEEPSPSILPVVSSRSGKGKTVLIAAGLALLVLGGAAYWLLAGRAAPTNRETAAGTAPAASTSPATAAPVASSSTSRTTESDPAAATPEVTTASSAPVSTLDRLALDLMSKERKAQDAAHEQQRADELARQRDVAAKAAAAKIAAGTAAASGTQAASNSAAAGTPAAAAATTSRAGVDAAAAPVNARPQLAKSALPAVTVPEQTAAPSAQDEALKSELERLRAELKNRQAGETVASKPAGSSLGSYRESMNAAIAGRLRYPQESRENQEEGTSTVRVRVQRNGAIVSAAVVQRTGFPMLDAEAGNVFSRIGRFAPVPADIYPGSNEVDFTLPIRFKLAER